MVSSMTEHDALRESPLLLSPSQGVDDGLEACTCPLIFLPLPSIKCQPLTYVTVVLSLRGPLPTGPPDRDIPSSPLLIYSLIDIVYRYYIAIQDSKIDAEYKVNYLSDTYQQCLLWYDTALGIGSQQSEICPFTQYVIDEDLRIAKNLTRRFLACCTTFAF